MTVATHRAGRTTWARLVAGVAAVGLLGVVSFTAQPAEAATKTNYGWHSICAQSLRMALGDYQYVNLTYGDYLYVDGFFNGYAIVQGTAQRYISGYGWYSLGHGTVSNGWFC